MLTSHKTLTAGLLLALTALPLAAAEGVDATVTARLAKMLPEYPIEGVEKTPVPGVYEVTLGAQVVYVSADGRYMMQGRLIDLDTREDLTESRRSAARKGVMAKVTDEQTVVFAPEKYTHTVSVFTDIDCGYCRKLHKEIEDYEKEGIRVRYLFYPRAGEKSASYDKAVSVWCADDRNQAMTDAKFGKDVAQKTCDNPVKAHMALGEQLGVRGTPALVLDNGEMVPGYVPAKRLAAMLNGKDSAN